jgi:hypothetical protein
MAAMLPLLLAALLLLPPPVASWQGSLVAVDISPSTAQVAAQDIFLGGYGALGFRDGATLGFARGVADPIYARALYLEDSAGHATAIVTLDATGIGNVVRDEIQEGVAAATGLAPEHVLVSATHTHCGPDFQGMWGGVSGSYRATAIQGAIAAVAWAAGNRTEVDLHISSLSDDSTAAMQSNRRGWNFTLNASVVLELRSVASGATIGLMVNWAAHPTTLGRSVLELSSDFGGYLCRHLEAAVPGSTAMWVNAALGDVSAAGCDKRIFLSHFVPKIMILPRQARGKRRENSKRDAFFRRATGEGFERPRSYGAAVGELALTAIRAGRTLLVGDSLELQVQAYTQPIENIAFVAAYLLGILSDYYDLPAGGAGVNAPTFAAHLRLGEELEMVTTPGAHRMHIS